MKKRIIFWLIIIVILVIASILIYISKFKDTNDNNLVNVKVAEVAHSVFYAPQYLADSLGYFEDEGLDVEINLTAGADAVMSAVLSDDVDIGFCGTEATIYVVDKKEKNYFIKNKIIPDPISNTKDMIKIITGKLMKAASFLGVLLYWLCSGLYTRTML